MYVRNWIGSRCTLPSTREEKRGAIVDPGEEREEEEEGKGRRGGEREIERGLDTEFWFRIPGHRAEFRVLSRSFFRPICLVDTDSQSTTIPCSLFASIGRMRFYRVSYFRRRHTPDGEWMLAPSADPRQNRYPIKTSAPLRNLLRLLQIDFSLPFQRWMERRVLCISSIHRVEECPRNFYRGLSLFFFFFSKS